MSANWSAGIIIGSVSVLILAIFILGRIAATRGTAEGPQFSQVYSIAASPSDPKRMFLGDASGLFMSTDAGKKWNRHVISEPVRKIYADPRDIQVLYTVGGSTIRKSADGGLTWKEVNTNLPSGDIYSLGSDPADSSKWYAYVTFRGVYRSQDGGTTWAPANLMPSANITSLAVKPGAPDTVYAFSDVDGFVMSTSNAVAFTPVESAILPVKRVSDLLTVPTEPNAVYAVAGRAVYKSDNGGGNWKKLETGLTSVSVVALGRNVTTGELLVTDTEGVVYASTDGGNAWRKVA